MGRGRGKTPDPHRIDIWLGHCAENPRICFANPHRLRPPSGVLARGLKTLTRFLYARALHRVRFSAVRTRNKKAGRYEYLPACYLWWRRGESAYLLRKYAPAAAACRRPRPLATNASRLLNARALHRVRFSAVRTRNKKAGRYEYLPACYLWWRRGESNSGPRKPPDWHLQAQSLV